MANYDVFLSYNSKDKIDVEQIARQLKDDRDLKVWLDKWNLIPGEPWQEEIEGALDDCKTVAVFLGPTGIGPWENEEMRAALDARVNKKILRVIPVLLPGAPDKGTLKLPTFLARLTWVDFRSGLGDKDAIHDLVCGVNGVPPGVHVPEVRLPGREVLPEPGVLQPGWRLPNHRNAIFTGREDKLKALAGALLYEPQTTGKAVPQVITCMMGIGKTQLAVEFCYRYGRFFQGVHWINARLDIEAEIAACGAEMDLPYWPETIREQIQVTLRAWQKSGPHLVVLDCIETPELLHKWLPMFNGFRLLLTSRHHDWPRHLGLETHPLEILSKSESLGLFWKLAPRLKEVPDAELETIAEQLGHLPLAIDLAGRYLDERRGLSPQGYLKELSDAGGGLEHTSLLDWVEGDSPTDHDTNLVSTFLLIWQQLTDEKPVDVVARKIFLACGYCAPNVSIPDKIIYHVVEGDERIADRALTRLFDLGLLTKNTAIHPLLAEFARHQDEDKKSLEILADALTRLSYEANTTGLPTVFAPLRPHVEATARAAEIAQRQRVADDLWGNLGTHYRIVAEFDKAEEADRQALTIDEQEFGIIDPKTALRFNNLGRVLHAEGKLEGARENYERALEIDMQALGPNDPTIALRLNNLGMILKDLGDLPRAKEKIRQALLIDKRAYGAHHHRLVRDINNLGLVLKDMYDLRRALKAFEHARAIDEKNFGKNHPNVARDIQNIGWVLKDMGRTQEALDAFRCAHSIEESVLGPNHPNVAINLNNIGWVLRALGSFEEALDLFDRARNIDEEAYGPIHPAVARDINNVGMILKDLGRYQEAHQTLTGALTIFEKVYSPDHPEVAVVNNRIGVVLKRQGRVEQAKECFQRALDIDEKVFGKEHPAIARDIHNLGLVMKITGEIEAGNQRIQHAMEIYEKFLPANHALIRAVHENVEIF